ncbi:hypothetical protein [Niastella vici]|uniref:hypothetical protein n=1 Tax=Niastella vici TaxID=1703345 RepID=UPI001C1FCE01|nr:hypothetical protein [Niastella vici]
MYRGFNLSIGSTEDFYETGKKIYDKIKNPIQKTLKDFISVSGVIEGSKLREHWFPQLNADVFIAHSHKDERNAIGLAGWLHQKFEITAFIDSCIWGYADDLLKIIDTAYCLDDDRINYNYQERNFSTAHVHMMLSTALTMMIDRTECIFLLNTPNSISSTETIKDKTTSPWLYSEIIMTQLVRRRRLLSHRPATRTFAKSLKLNERLEIEHDVDISGLTNLDRDGLLTWLRKWNRKPFHKEAFPLDYLYELFDDSGKEAL